MRTRTILLVAASFGIWSCGSSSPKSTTCTTSSDCSAGEVCSAGACSVVKADAGCSASSDCPAGEVCRGDRSCGACGSDAQCDGGNGCSDGGCAPSSVCKVNSDCASGQVCKSGGTCGACVSASECASSESCVNGGCTSAAPCTKNASCSDGQSCKAGVCAACSANADCDAGEACKAGACGPCAGDADCSAGSYCSSGKCAAIPTDGTCAREGDLCSFGNPSACLGQSYCVRGTRDNQPLIYCPTTPAAQDSPCSLSDAEVTANPCAIGKCDGTSTTCRALAGAGGRVCHRRDSSLACDQDVTCSDASTACPSDGTAPSGTQCAAAPDACHDAPKCNGTDKTCPAAVDNCPLSPANAVGRATCVDGKCKLPGCNVGYADCDGNALNGCEAKLDRDNNNCGACGTACPTSPAHATKPAVCEDSVCYANDCQDGWGFCGVPGSTKGYIGCSVDFNTDRNNCGQCGFKCPADCLFPPCMTVNVCVKATCCKRWGYAYSLTDCPQ